MKIVWEYVHVVSELMYRYDLLLILCGYIDVSPDIDIIILLRSYSKLWYKSVEYQSVGKIEFVMVGFHALQLRKPKIYSYSGSKLFCAVCQASRLFVVDLGRVLARDWLPSTTSVSAIRQRVKLIMLGSRQGTTQVSVTHMGLLILIRLMCMTSLSPLSSALSDCYIYVNKRIFCRKYSPHRHCIVSGYSSWLGYVLLGYGWTRADPFLFSQSPWVSLVR